MLVKKNKITKKMFIDTTIVLVIAELTGAITCVIDGIITGRFLGNEAMAAYNYSCSYFSIVSIINGILMVGNQTLCVEALSKGRKEDVNRIISLTALLGITLTLIIAVLMFSFSKTTAILFGVQGSDESIISNFIPYIKGVCLGAPFWCLYVALTPIMQLDGAGQRAKVAAIFVGITDVTLDILLGVVLKSGMLGMGLATSISHMVGCFIVVSYFFKKKSTYKFVFKNFCFNKTLALLKNGLPRAVSMIARTIGPIILNIIIVNIDNNSTNGLTALSVQRSISFAVASIGWGICGTVLMLGSLFYNEKNLTELKSLIKYSLFSIVVIIGGFSLVLIAITPFITRLFQADWQTNVELYQLTNIALRYFMASLVFVGFNVSVASYMQSVGKMVLANIINAFVECIALISACYVLSSTHQYVGFFAGYLYGEMALSIALIGYILIHYLLHKKEPNSLYFIKPNYINDQDGILEASLTNYDEVEELSIKAIDLCKASHLDNKQAYKVGLCVEELACNVFEHGFKKDNKKHIVEMRIVVSENEASITLIDDCKAFDISKKLKSWEIDKEHPEKNMGIRTIMLLARKVIYANTLNMNHLQIII